MERCSRAFVDVASWRGGMRLEAIIAAGWKPARRGGASAVRGASARRPLAGGVKASSPSPGGRRGKASITKDRRRDGEMLESP
jgi:hypothetical protein